VVLVDQTPSYLEALLAALCGICGLNLTAESAEKRKENLVSERPLRIIEMASRALVI
jgi:hypothetical protein